MTHRCSDEEAIAFIREWNKAAYARRNAQQNRTRQS